MHGDIYETVVEFERGSKEILVSSTDSVWIRKIKKLCDERPDEVRIVGQDDISICVKMPISFFSLRPKKKCVLSDEQKAANAERMRRFAAERKAKE